MATALFKDRTKRGFYKLKFQSPTFAFKNRTISRNWVICADCKPHYLNPHYSRIPCTYFNILQMKVRSFAGVNIMIYCQQTGWEQFLKNGDLTKKTDKYLHTPDFVSCLLLSQNNLTNFFSFHFQISLLATVVSSGVRTTDVFRSAGIAMATRTVPTERMRAIVQLSRVQKPY